MHYTLTLKTIESIKKIYIYICQVFDRLTDYSVQVCHHMSSSFLNGLSIYMRQAASSVTQTCEAVDRNPLGVLNSRHDIICKLKLLPDFLL